MAEPSHRPKPPRAAADARRDAPNGETARAADSVPVPTGPFPVLPVQFGRYRVERMLGKGAMGAVYLAHDSQLDRPVALKVARVSASGSAKLIQRMEHEAKAAAKIDHSQICKVYDFGEIDGIRFIALQYIEGEDLKSYLRRVGRRREPTEAVNLLLQIARALQAAHGQGVIHRDLKPENIMLRKGEPVIMDFGLARRAIGATDAGLTQGMIVGTAAYMSPEQAIGKAEGIDHRSDLYSLGVMLFEMLTGDWPFTGTAIEVMGKKCVQDPPSPLTLNPALPQSLASLCHKLISQKKEDRFHSCAELVTALETIEWTPSATPLATAIDPPPSTASRTTHDTSPEFDAPAPSPKASATMASARLPKKRPAAKVTAMPLKWWRSRSGIVTMTVIGLAAIALLALSPLLGDGKADVRIHVLVDDIQVSFLDKSITKTEQEQRFRIAPGEQQLHVTGDTTFDTRKFPIKRGDNPMLTVKLDKSDIVVSLGTEEIDRKPQTPAPRQPEVPASSDLDRIATGKWLALANATITLSDPNRIKFKDGVLDLNDKKVTFSKVEARDLIVRADVRKLSGQNLGIGLRTIDNPQMNGNYGMWFNGTQFATGDHFGISKWKHKRGEAGTSKDLTSGSIGRKFQKDQFVNVAIAAIGNQISLYVDGTRVLSCQDREYDRGVVEIIAYKGASQFRNLEYQILDPPTSFTAATAISSPDSRKKWVHSAGQFVEVDGGIWEELSPSGKTFRYMLVGRTKEYLDLDAITGDLRLRYRLYSDRCESELRPSPSHKTLYQGKWSE